MDQRDRDAIDDLFDKIARVEAQSGPRDGEAEAYIRSLVAAQPSAPYFMAQTIVVQEQALTEAQRRIDELENRGGRQPSGGGFLESIFGGGRPSTSRAPVSRTGSRQGYDEGGPWASRGGMMGGGYGRGGMGGGGFLAGAAQTAMGVAGGVVLGNMIADMLSPDEAAAAGLDDNAGTDNDNDVADQNDAGETEVADAGDDFGDFDAGDF